MTSKLTREFMQDIITGHGHGVAPSAVEEMAKYIASAMDSEPVAWTDEEELRDVERSGCGYLFTVNPVTPHADERRIILLYRHAQPSQVVTSDDSVFEAAIDECRKSDSIDEHAWNYGVLAVIANYEACRTAMLSAAAPQQEVGSS